MITENDLYTGLQFKYKGIGTLYTIELGERVNVFWIDKNNYRESTYYSVKEVCNNINEGSWIIKEIIYELW